MVWFPSGEMATLPPEGLTSGHLLARWRSPTEVTAVWSVEGVWFVGAELHREPGVAVETPTGRYFYPGLSVESFLEVLAEAWAQRGPK